MKKKKEKNLCIIYETSVKIIPGYKKTLKINIKNKY